MRLSLQVGSFKGARQWVFKVWTFGLKTHFFLHINWFPLNPTREIKKIEVMSVIRTVVSFLRESRLVQEILFDLIHTREISSARVAGRSYFRAALWVLGDGRLRSLYETRRCPHSRF